MEQLITFFIIFMFCNLLFLVLRQWLKIKDLKLQKTIAENEIKITENMYRNQVSILQGQINNLLKMKTIQNPIIPPNTIQAVKYAMKHAHPDNGGNAEEFMKFQKCYEELTRK